MPPHRSNRATPIIDGKKLCRDCGQSKPVAEFPRSAKLKDGVYSQCKVCANAYNRRHRLENPSAYVYAKTWQYRNPEHRRRYLADRYRALKRQIVLAYGMRCALCGFSDERALHIDHVLEDGAQDRKRRTPLQRMQYIVSKNYPPEYQILCANCNTIKACEAGSLRYTSVERKKVV